MNRITRYVVTEILKTFGMSLTAMTSFIVLIFLVQEALREKMTLTAVLRLIPYLLPTALCFAIPATMLFAVCVIYGRMSANNEIVTIKSSGISPSVVMVPGLVVAFLLSLVTVFLNDVSVSWGRRGIYKVVLESSSQTIYTMLRAQGQFAKGQIFINVDDVDGDVLVHPFIVRTNEKGEDTFSIRALSARILVDVPNEQLILSLKNAQISQGKSFESHLDQKDIPIELSDVTKRNDTSSRPWNLPLREMQPATLLHSQHLKSLRQAMATRLVSQQIGGDMVGLTHPEWGAELYELREAKFDGYRLAAEPWRRWANGFSCLSFVVLGIPLSVLFKRFDFWTNFAFCFIPILVLYYPLLMYGIGQAKAGGLPPYSVWLGNIVLLIIGGTLVHRVNRN
ncbi:MAG: LptF/LptG family permease [Pirellulaceae bacterium]